MTRCQKSPAIGSRRRSPPPPEERLPLTLERSPVRSARPAQAGALTKAEPGGRFRACSIPLPRMSNPWCRFPEAAIPHTVSAHRSGPRRTMERRPAPEGGNGLLGSLVYQCSDGRLSSGKVQILVKFLASRRKRFRHAASDTTCDSMPTPWIECLRPNFNFMA